MNSFALICILLCAVAGASSASLRYRRQWPPRQFDRDRVPWPNPPPFRVDRPIFNEVINFPEADDFPNRISAPSFRPKPRPSTTTGPGQDRRTTTMRTTTASASTSTTRTFHLVPEGCDCPSTPQFNPVCGSDGNTYKNAGLLQCFQRCGSDVTQRRMGTC